MIFSPRIFLLFVSLFFVNIHLFAQVKIWEEALTLPTYKVDPPDKNPMFFTNASYQGASKVIYPYPLEDDMTSEKIEKSYQAVYLENEYLKICILPEIGGRLFYATDKTNNYEIFYRQHVIKPAHVGMLGAWISGGIEFCVFHHHRASTNMPIDYKLENNKDGKAASSGDSSLANYPTIAYYLGYIAHLKGDKINAKSYFSSAKNQSTDYCFPYRMETEAVYETALSYDKSDAKAYYYYGNLLYDKQPERAIGYWEKAVANDKDMAIAYRNLGWGYDQMYEDLDKAIESYEMAVKINNQDPRYYLELDKLYQEKGTPVEKRHELLSKNHKYVSQLNSALIREISVAVAARDYDHAIEQLTTVHFNRREGSNDLHDLYVDAMLLRGIKHLSENQLKAALADFEAADEYPANQYIGRNEDSQRRAQIFYFQGLVHEKMGNDDQAKQLYQKSVGIEVYKPAYAYHQAQSYIKLGEKEEATALFEMMKEKGEGILSNQGGIDFFKKFGRKQTKNVRNAGGHYLVGLAALGMNDSKTAKQHFEKGLIEDPGNYWLRNVYSSTTERK